MTNDFTHSLRSGRAVTMVNVGGRNPDVMPMLRKAGADAAFIDCERTGIALDAATDLILACKACGLPAVVRSHSLEGPELVRFLDRGADALVVPHIASVAQVRAAAEVMQYACGGDVEERSLIIQVETKGALSQLREIAGVPGIDAFLVGPNDIAYEFTGQRGRHNAESHAAIEEACATLRSLGKCFGYPAKRQDLPTFKSRGARLRYVAIEWLIEAGMAAESGEGRLADA